VCAVFTSPSSALVDQASSSLVLRLRDGSSHPCVFHDRSSLKASVSVATSRKGVRCSGRPSSAIVRLSRVPSCSVVRLKKVSVLLPRRRRRSRSGRLPVQGCRVLEIAPSNSAWPCKALWFRRGRGRQVLLRRDPVDCAAVQSEREARVGCASSGARGEVRVVHQLPSIRLVVGWLGCCQSVVSARFSTSVALRLACRSSHRSSRPQWSCVSLVSSLASCLSPVSPSSRPQRSCVLLVTRLTTLLARLTGYSSPSASLVTSSVCVAS